MTSYSIINRDDQGNPLVLNEVLINTFVGAIAVRKAIGQVDFNLRPQLLEHFLHNRSTGHSIGIIITIDQNRLSSLDGRLNPSNCLFHILKKKRIS